MKVGAEPKKVAVLVGLLVVAGVVYFMNSGDSSTPTSGSTRVQSQSAAAPAGVGTPPADTPLPGAGRRRPASAQFSPSLRPKRGEQRPDPMTIDPTLRLELLAKLQTVSVEGTRRSVFDFGQAPVPKPDPVKTAAVKPVPNPIVPITPAPVDQAKVEPAKPQAPPIPLKFYGYVNPAGMNAGPKRAFFMEGEDIFVAREGEVVKRRYKIVRIGVNSAVVEDTQFGSQQTLPLEEQQG